MMTPGTANYTGLPHWSSRDARRVRSSIRAGARGGPGPRAEPCELARWPVTPVMGVLTCPVPGCPVPGAQLPASGVARPKKGLWALPE